MTKRILITAALISLFSFSAFAQKVSGSFKSLKEEVRVQMDIDFSSADIMGMNEEAFSDYEQDWNIDKPEILGYIYAYANKGMGGNLAVGNYPNHPGGSKLVLKVVSVSVKGDYDCDLYLYDAEGREIGKTSGIRGKGGTFGTKLNLMKDGARRTGAAVGRFLYSARLR